MKATIFDGTTVKPYDPGDAQALSTSTPYVWIAAAVTENPDPQVSQLLNQMGFSDIVANYTTRKNSSGMFQAFGDNMLASTYATADDHSAPVLVHCVWNAGCFVTIQQGADQAIATALEDIKPRAAQLFTQPGPVPGILLQLILDSIDRQLTDLETKVGLLDGQIIVTANPSQMTQLQQLRAPIEGLVAAIPPYAQNLSQSLVDPSSLPGVDSGGAEALQTYQAGVNDVVQRISSIAGDVRNAIQDYQGQVSAAQGYRINQLTLVSTIFLPITFMTGYFGMNFQWLVNSTVSFVSWVIFGFLLPVGAVIVSARLLGRGGFKVGHGTSFHLAHHKRGTSDTAAPKPPQT
ncbi:MAG: CorA family divalent cation transporter [Actinomycetota bacterium]